MGIEFLDCLKRERDISIIETMSSGGEMAFMWSPALTQFSDGGEIRAANA